MSKPIVLVVDDSKEARLLFRMILEMRGYDVIEAEDAVVALDLISSQPFDIIVLDVALANIDGFMIAREIRQGVWEEINQHTYIVGVSGLYLAKRDMSKAATGMDAFFDKPLDIHKFANSLDDVVRRKAG